MKHKLICFFFFLVLSSLAACGSQESTSSATSSEPHGSQPAEQMENGQKTAGTEGNREDTKILVAYFSVTGKTKALATFAADAMGADLYEIAPEDPYTSEDLDYGNNDSRSAMEQSDESTRPAISGRVDNMEQYTVVFLGYPIWWGEAPRIINAFMESYDFSGMTLVPFCTSDSSPIGSSAQNLHDLAASNVNWLDGERLSSHSTREDIVGWINGLGLDVTAE